MDVKRIFLHIGFFALPVAMVWGQVDDLSNLPSTPFSTTEVSEAAAIGDFLFALQSFDADGDELTLSAVTSDTLNTVDVGPTVQGSDGNWMTNVTLKQRLDRDKSPAKKRLYFKLSDGYGEFFHAFDMIIKDVNDNPPRFVGLPYTTSIPEDFEINETFFTVSATDPDLDMGGRVEYTLVVDNTEFSDTFDIHLQTGAIKLKKHLDYEDRSFYHLKVSATDLGELPCPGVSCLCNEADGVECKPEPVDLFITVEDVQDTPPVFQGLLEVYYVREDRHVSDPVLRIQAVDGDRGVAVPNQIRYSLDNASASPFSLDDESGTISVTQTLDPTDPRSTDGLYILSVTATEVFAELGPARVSDPAVPTQATSQTKVSVVVTDVDDHYPQFNNWVYFAFVSENMPRGSQLTLDLPIEVFDLDQGKNSRFRIFVRKDGLPYLGFSTVPESSQIIYGSSSITIYVENALLDYETEDKMYFELVFVEEPSGDSTQKYSSPHGKKSTVLVALSDANDNSPVFTPTQTSSFSLSEDARLGLSVGTITAEDADSADFGTVTFSFETGGDVGEFSISDEGVITVAKPLDREIRSAYRLVVIATDSPGAPLSRRRSSRFPINVTVLDVNDFHPRWPEVIPVVSVRESASVGSKVVDLKAVDLDEGINGEVEYSIVPTINEHSLFMVREVDGRAELQVGSSLIGLPGVRHVKVKATDKGEQPLSTETEFTIIVTSERRFHPVHTYPGKEKYNPAPGDLPDIAVHKRITCKSADGGSWGLSHLFTIIAAVLGVLVLVLVLVIVHTVWIYQKGQPAATSTVSGEAKEQEVPVQPAVHKYSYCVENPIFNEG